MLLLFLCFHIRRHIQNIVFRLCPRLALHALGMCNIESMVCVWLMTHNLERWKNKYYNVPCTCSFNAADLPTALRSVLNLCSNANIVDSAAVTQQTLSHVNPFGPDGATLLPLATTTTHSAACKYTSTGGHKMKWAREQCKWQDIWQAHKRYWSNAAWINCNHRRLISEDAREQTAHFRQRLRVCVRVPVLGRGGGFIDLQAPGNPALPFPL